MRVPFINFGKNYLRHKEEIDQAIQRVLTNGDLILRKDVEEFEQSFAKYVGVKYCVAVNSGTDALYLALKAIGVEQGDLVQVPSHTFVATAQVVNQIGAEVKLYDMDNPLELDTGKYFQICNNAKAIIYAHIAGEIFNADHAKPNHNIPIIEDACQALGALKNPTSKAQCWSFYPAKTLGCFGDGGALTTNDEHIYNYVKEARNHFKSTYSDWGINSRLDNIQAAILNVKLKYLDEDIAKRKQIAQRYDAELKNIGLPTVRDVYQDYIITTDKRDELYDYLKEKGIETMKNEYPMPIGKLPKAAEYESKSLRLPCNPEMTVEEVNYVIESINNWK